LEKGRPSNDGGSPSGVLKKNQGYIKGYKKKEEMRRMVRRIRVGGTTTRRSVVKRSHKKIWQHWREKRERKETLGGCGTHAC